MFEDAHEVTLVMPCRKPDERFRLTVDGLEIRHVRDVKVFNEGSVTYVSATFVANVNVPEETDGLVHWSTAVKPKETT